MLTSVYSLQALLKETEKILNTWKHPDPYCHPTAPGGMIISDQETSDDPDNVLTVCPLQAPNTSATYHLQCSTVRVFPMVLLVRRSSN